MVRTLYYGAFVFLNEGHYSKMGRDESGGCRFEPRPLMP